MAKLEISVNIKVPFHDVDSMNVVWHGHYVKYFEIARSALLQLFDYDYPQMKESGYFWPIVECHLKYVRPAVYNQKLCIATSLLEYESRIKVGYEIFDIVTGERLTKGYTTQVAIDIETRELQFVSPPIVFSNLEKVCKEI